VGVEKKPDVPGMAGYRAIKAALIDGQETSRGRYAIKERQPETYLQETGIKYKKSVLGRQVTR